MKQILTILLFVVVFSFAARAQEPAIGWLKGYGGNIDDGVATQVTRTQDGGFIIVIGTNSDTTTGNIDSLCNPTRKREIFVKYNADASVIEWSKCYGYGDDSSLDYYFPTSDGGNILGGVFTDGWGFVICKEDVSGGIVWQHNYSKGNGAILRSMIAANDGGYFMLGESLYTDSNVSIHYGSSFDPDLWILKVDSNGNKVWSKVIGGTGYESGGALVSAPGGGCYVVGGTGSYDYDCTGNHGGGEVYLARLDSNGNLLWHKDMGGTTEEVGTAAFANNKGGVVIAALAHSDDGDVHHHIGGSDYWVLEVDSSGNILWDNCYGTSTSDEIPYAVCKATDGSIWMNGYGYGSPDTAYGHEDAWIVHADSAGNYLSAKVVGSTGQDEGYMIYSLSNGSVIAGGYYTDNNGAFSTLPYYGTFGSTNAFLAVFAPWTTDIRAVNETSISFKIYPNPTRDVASISLNDFGESSKIVITNSIGQQVYVKDVLVGQQNIRADLSGMCSGVYCVQLILQNGQREVQKLVIE